LFYRRHSGWPEADVVIGARNENQVPLDLDYGSSDFERSHSSGVTTSSCPMRTAISRQIPNVAYRLLDSAAAPPRPRPVCHRTCHGGNPRTFESQQARRALKPIEYPEKRSCAGSILSQVSSRAPEHVLLSRSGRQRMRVKSGSKQQEFAALFQNFRPDGAHANYWRPSCLYKATAMMMMPWIKP
jgi:hypothetical protein